MDRWIDISLDKYMINKQIDRQIEKRERDIRESFRDTKRDRNKCMKKIIIHFLTLKSKYPFRETLTYIIYTYKQTNMPQFQIWGSDKQHIKKVSNMMACLF